MTENSVSAGAASDVKTLGAAALLTYSAGVLLLVGYLLLGVFGAILGAVGAVFGVIWWRRTHDDKVFPRDLSVKSLVVLVVVAVAVTLLAFALAA
ncbi:membrane associated rhomboid family serine protease [Amycolatopsis bartoniae]|uniref:Uncharacterized protein n=1 Tax=Amycolatopsis bartoniae TaxID=941986 RepID=A0A8H9J2T8_9PSEU|nr:hypothetical protein [Amycolatopsis bartoniae]MBB2934085.1 membrane associated rhomboid family serine protease [Amycolatopsis bartoniae]TVT07374.1 hypothetical protein FNH07_16675 [Amycolatopsis bartoniae]GHF84463.1 hypothetical protein GCM10017566_68140 [Amycolatopsis bartoniae]